MAEARVSFCVKGHLRLSSARSDAGRTFLSAQSFRAPLHLSKPHADAGALVANIVNPTAGLFENDETDIDVSVETGARLVLTTPSANRIYKARGDGWATSRQCYRIATGGSLEFFPELTIPQAGSRFRQQTEIRVAPGGALLFFEWLAPGRVASGECFRYDRLEWRTDLWLGERLNLRERYELRPGSDSLASLQRLFPASHYVSCVVVGDIEFPCGEITAIEPAGVYLGHTPLGYGGWVIKALCRDGLCARHVMRQLRLILYRAFDREAPTLGRY